ncbi:hypothetical protein PO909_001522 [Leuciscus waleckii]
MLGLMASASSVLQPGLLRMRPLQYWLKARAPRRAWTSGLACLKVDQKCVAALKPWTVTDWYRSGVSLGTSSSVKVVSTNASTSGWGALLEGRPLFGQWSEREKLLHINCLEMMAVDNALRRFLSPDKKTPRLGPFGQHVSGGLYKSPRRYQIQNPSQADGTPPGLGSAQSALAQGSACARPSECGTRQTVQKQSSDRRMVFTPTDSRTAMEDIWQSENRPICVSRERSLSRIFLQEQGRVEFVQGE